MREYVIRGTSVRVNAFRTAVDIPKDSMVAMMPDGSLQVFATEAFGQVFDKAPSNVKPPVMGKAVPLSKRRTKAGSPKEWTGTVAPRSNEMATLLIANEKFHGEWFRVAQDLEPHVPRDKRVSLSARVSTLASRGLLEKRGPGPGHMEYRVSERGRNEVRLFEAWDVCQQPELPGTKD